MKASRISPQWLFFIFTLIIHLSLGAAHAPAFDIDTDFGTQGTVVHTIDEADTRGRSLLIDGDGGIIVGGSTIVSAQRYFALLRLTSDGELDTSFQTDGTLTTEVGSGDAEIMDLAFTTDDAIIAGGYTTAGTDDTDFALACYNADGSLCDGFGVDGLVLGNNSYNDAIHGVAVDSEGRIVIAGYSTTITDQQTPLLTRYLADGTEDPAFNISWPLFDAIDNDVILNDLELLDDDSIIAVGTKTDSNGLKVAMVIRVLDTGELDDTFGDDGVAYPADDETSSTGSALNLLSGDRILVTGALGELGSRDSVLFLFSEDGVAYDEFGTNGLLNVGLEDIDDLASDLVVTDTGVGIGGYSLDSYGSKNFLFISVLEVQESDGTSQWDISSMITTFGSDDQALAVAAVSSDKIIAAGITNRTSEPVGAALARYDISESTLAPADNSKKTTETSLSTTSNYTEVSNAWFVTTRQVTSISETSATSGGEIQSSGDLSFSKRGVVFSTSADPVYPRNDTNDTDDEENSSLTQSQQSGSFVTDGVTVNGSGTGSFYSKMEDLRPGTTYYVRAYALTSNDDIYYGHILRFETAEACFIATAAFGSVLHPQVSILRDFRDRYLMNNTLGRSLVDFYYLHSPSLADIIAENNALRTVTQYLLFPIIALGWLTLHPILFAIMVSCIGVATLIGLRKRRITRQHRVSNPA